MDLNNDTNLKLMFIDRFRKFPKKKLHNYVLYSDCQKMYFIYKLEMNCICSKNINKNIDEIFDLIKNDYEQFKTKSFIEYKYKKYNVNVYINHELNLISIEKLNN